MILLCRHKGVDDEFVLEIKVRDFIVVWERKNRERCIA